MKANSTQARNHGTRWTIALLAAVLGLLFWRSFLPGVVHFSNDGPLGELECAWIRLPGAFNGPWDDLNSLGFNFGSWATNVTALICLSLGPVGYAKFLPPIALFILGIGAWTFFRQLKFTPLAATLGMFAAVLNSTFFASACWGVASQQIAIGMDFFAMALVVSNTPETSGPIRWTRLALAGLAVGMNVMEAADIGAIFSLFVAAFVLFKAAADEGGPVWVKLGRGVSHVAVIAVFAGFIATQTVVSLIGSSITGIAGTGQDAETKARHWSWATQWSLPKMEALGLVVPGLFGYRMDTPKDMMEFLQDSYRGGTYWGSVGRDLSLDPYFEGGRKGPAPPGSMRFTGGQNYAGILVALVAFWAVAQSLRRRDSVFAESQRRLIWFWAAVLAVSLPLAFGRFAPFYKYFYMLPYCSTIRNPAKFLIVFSWALAILFAYGIHALSRRHLETPAGGAVSFKNWWTKACGFDRNWALGCGAAFGISVCAWLIYVWQRPGFVRYLQTVGFGDDMAGGIAAFSIGQAGWFLSFFALTIGLFLLVIAGVFAGKRARLGGILLGVLLVVDLGRADLPYVIHWDYEQKYDVDPANPASSTNPIINFLRTKPYEHRVAYGLPRPLSTPPQFELFNELYGIEWAQHHFPYYNIQSLDKIQMPRVSADLEAFEGALRIGIRQDSAGRWMLDPGTFPRIGRLWELTNTRYLLGPAGLPDLFNEQFDPGRRRFRIVQRFTIALKPGVREFHQRLEELTAVPNDNGDYAIIEFTGALPRAKLYSNWQANSPAALNGFTTNGLSGDELNELGNIGTNGFLTLKQLVSPAFDPQQTVLVSMPLPTAPAADATNQNSGTVEYKSYTPKDIVLNAQAGAPSVLLLNDKFDPHWNVFVDGRPAPLLRCNFIMRGVYLTPGPHTVEFKFTLPNGPLCVSLTAISVGILLCGFLIFSGRRNSRLQRDRE